MLIFKRCSRLQSFSGMPLNRSKIQLKEHFCMCIDGFLTVMVFCWLKINTKFVTSVQLLLISSNTSLKSHLTHEDFRGFLLTSTERCTLYKIDSLQAMTIHHKSWKCEQAAPIMLHKITREFYHDHQ